MIAAGSERRCGVSNSRTTGVNPLAKYRTHRSHPTRQEHGQLCFAVCLWPLSVASPRSLLQWQVQLNLSPRRTLKSLVDSQSQVDIIHPSFNALAGVWRGFGRENGGRGLARSRTATKFATCPPTYKHILSAVLLFGGHVPTLPLVSGNVVAPC
jgi:hypothetical protein